MSLGGLDVGTTVCRLIVFDSSGKIIASAYGHYPLITSKEWLEIDPRMLWNAVCSVCGAVSEKIKDDPLEAIGVSAMGDTLIITDENLNPVRNAILASDTRSNPQCEKLVSTFGVQTIFDKTGMPAHSMTTVTKIAWVLDNLKNENISPAEYMCTEDFVIGKLTGRPFISWSTAARTMLFNSEKKEWWTEIIDFLGFSANSLSNVSPSATLVGKIKPALANNLGLPEGLPIIIAGHDQMVSAIGSGALQNGVISDNTGTFECVIACVEEKRKPAIDKQILAESNLALYPHGPRGLWAAFGWFNAGSIVKWCKDNLFALEVEKATSNGIDVYQQIFQNMELKPIDLYFLPHFTGSGTPWLDSTARGALYGMDLNTSRYDILLAAIQGVGFDLILNLSAFERAGVALNRILATGGGSKSPVWLQLKSNITGKEITVAEVTEASAMGAAICAGTAIGLFKSLEEGAQNMVTLGKTYRPDQEMHLKYGQMIEKYRALFESCKQFRARQSQD